MVESLTISNKQYATGGYSKWTTIGEDNQFYSGKSGGSYYRSRMSFNTNGLIISSVNSLTLTLTIAQNSSPKGLMGVLTTSSGSYLVPSKIQNDVVTGPSTDLNSIKLATSYAYDINNNIAGVNVSDGNKIYLKFTGMELESDETYWIYLIRTTNNYTGTGFCGLQASSATLNLNYNSYTNCSQPSNLSITSLHLEKTIAKDQNLTIAWNSATGGTNNPVSGYRVYYKISDEGDKATLNDPYTEVNATQSTATIPTKDLGSGKKIYFGVQTRGENGYHSDLKLYSSALVVNTPPPAPNASSNQIILTSTGASKSITLSMPTNYNGEVAYKYKFGNGTITDCSSSSPTVGKVGYYYFYAHDGLNLSASTCVTVTKNTAPAIKTPEVSIINGAGQRARGFSVTVTNKAGNPTQYKYVVQVGTNKTETTLQNWTTSKSYECEDIRNIIGANKQFQIGVYCKDSIESSSINTNNTSYQTYSNPTANDITISNEISDSNWQGYYSSKIVFKCTSLQSNYDYTHVCLTNSSGTVLYIKKYEANGTVFTIGDDTSGHSRGNNNSFYFKLKNSYTGDYSTTYEFGSKYRIKKTISKLNETWDGVIDPYVADNGVISIRRFFSNSDFEEYGLNTNVLENLKSKFTIGASFGNKTNWQEISKLDGTSDTLKLTISGANIYNLFYNVSSDKKDTNAKYTANMFIKLTNVFGESYVISSTNFKKEINWMSQSKSEVTSLKVSKDGDFTFIKEGVKFNFALQFKSYHTPPSKVTIKGYKDTYYFLNDIIDIKTNSSGSLGHKNPKLYTVNFSATIKQINKDKTDNSTLNFSASLNDELSTFSKATTLSDPSNIKIYRHVAPSFQLVSGNYDSTNEKLNLTLDVINKDINNDINNYGNFSATLYRWSNGQWNLQSSVFNNEPLSNLIDSNYSIDINSSSFGNSEKFYLKITTNLFSDTNKTFNKSSYTALSNNLVVYKAAPTMSFQQNQVGINYSFSENEGSIPTKASLIIGASGNNKYVYFIGDNRKAYIELESGELEGFTIDCGSW